MRLNSKAYKIFCKFFERYEFNIKDTQVRISMEEVETLMNHLDQDMDRSKGKGSHTKITLNFQENNFENFYEEQMMILANHTYLKPYQIKQLRLKFIQNGLYPSHLKEKLEQKWIMK
ncbi:MAG: hypothetical protein ACRYGR_02095 [Janthinobacterium lividum]